MEILTVFFAMTYKIMVNSAILPFPFCGNLEVKFFD